MHFLDSFSSSGSFIPLGNFYIWVPGPVWLHAVSDSLVALAYLSIPFTLAWFVRKRTGLPFDWIFLAFGIFILACGATGVMEVWNLWHADYWAGGVIKAITAASLITAALLVRLVPHALALTNPAALKIEIAERTRTEETGLKLDKSELESRVEERTAELKKVNQNLVFEIERYRRIEQDLRESEERLRLAQDASGMGVWEWDTRSDRLEWSDQTFRIFGLQPGEQKLDESTFLTLIHPEDRAAVKAAIRAALRPGGEYDAEYRIQPADGSMRWVLAHGRMHCDNQGSLSRMIGLCLDVTERRQAAEELRCSKERFRLLVEGIADYAIFMLDAEGFVSSWNSGAERITGYRAEEIIGQHFSSFFGDEDLRKGKPAMALREAAAIGRFEEDGWRVRKDGSRFQANAILNALHDPKGNLIGFAKITRDLTESRRAEDAVQAAQAELARVVRMSTLGEITASIAHEINQPLVAIVNNANACRRMLSGPDPDIEDVQQALTEITEAGTRAGEIIFHIRAFVKKGTPQKSLVDMNQVIHEVIDLIPGVLENQHVSLEMELRPSLPPVLGDRVQLQQVLLNLIMNSVEAMSMVRDHPRVLVIRSDACDSGPEVAVQDSGTGLDPRSRERIFDTFFTTKPDGMGMGLSICRSIIEAHKGRLWASGDPAIRGATFRFSLPPAA